MIVETLLNPNLAYLFLVAGFLLVMMAIFSPGTGYFEVGALFALAFAGWQMYVMPVHWWALLLLAVGVIPFWIAVRRSGNRLYLALSILALIIGSTFLFQGEGWRPSVNPALAITVSTLTAGFMWLVTVKTLEAQQIRPSHDLSNLIGQLGLARTPIHYEGAVWVKMEEWSARSETPIPTGSRVRIIDREGFVLVVAPFETETHAEETSG